MLPTSIFAFQNDIKWYLKISLQKRIWSSNGRHSKLDIGLRRGVTYVTSETIITEETTTTFLPPKMPILHAQRENEAI